MSGGSYNYLCHKVADGMLADAPGFSDLEEMAKRLDGLGWADEAATRVRSIIARAEALDAELAHLGDVFHAVEWWDSCDWSEGQAREVVDKHQANG